MKAVVYRSYGRADALTLEDWPAPEPAAGEVRVAVKAAAFNGFDPMILMQSTTLKNPMPMVPCGDSAGVIDALGAGVTGWRVGDRVSLLPFGDFGMMGETALGAARDFVTVPAANLVRMPDEVSFVDAAALPVAYGTAYRMLGVRGQIKPGEKVLILGAAGGVGTCCVQLAKSMGAEVIACASGAWKRAALIALGADHVIDTAAEDFVTAVRERFGRPKVDGSGGGVDVVVNYVGGDTWDQSLKVLKRHGRLLTCGASAGFKAQTDIRYIWSFEQTIVGADGWEIADQAALLEMTARGALKPFIHKVRPFSQAGAAMQEMIDRKVIGKSILVPDGAA